MANNNPPLQCPICESAVKHIPAGISKKTGKPYNEFWSCISMECSFTWRPQKKGTRARPQAEYDQGEKIIEGLRQIYKILEERLPKN